MQTRRGSLTRRRRSPPSAPTASRSCVATSQRRARVGRAGARGDRHGHATQPPAAGAGRRPPGAGRASRVAGHRGCDRQARPRAAEHLPRRSRRAASPRRAPPYRADGVAVTDLAERWAHASARSHAWRGLALYAVDGTTRSHGARRRLMSNHARKRRRDRHDPAFRSPIGMCARLSLGEEDG